MRSKRAKGRSALSRSISDQDPYDPTEEFSKISADTMFSDLPDSYSDTTPFDTSLLRCTNALMWAIDGHGTSAADSVVNVIGPVFAKNIPIADLSTAKPFGPNWYQWGVTIRTFYNALWAYKGANAMPDLQSRIEKANQNITQVSNVPQIGSNYVLVATCRAWALRNVLGKNPVTDTQVLAVNEHLPKMENNVLWPSNGNLAMDGSFVFHDTLRGYGYLRNTIRSIMQLNLIAPGIVTRTSEIVDAFKLVQPVSRYTSPPLFTRTLENNTPIVYNRAAGIAYIHGIRTIVQAQPNWYFAIWANNDSLAYAEVDVGAQTLYNLFTTPFNFGINTQAYSYSTDLWRLVPGMVFPADAPTNPNPNATKTYNTTTTKAAGIVSRDGRYAGIIDIIANDAIQQVVTRRVLITPNGIKVGLSVDSPTSLYHNLYSGRSIAARGSGWMVDNVYVCGNLSYEQSTESGVAVLRAELQPGKHDILFNIMYNVVDDDLPTVTDNSIAAGNVSLKRDATNCCLMVGQHAAINTLYDANVVAPVVYKNGSIVTLASAYNATLTDSTFTTADPILFGESQN